ncbi:MAG: hypothetical protein ACOVQ8_00595 [Elstera sp.]
MTAPRKPSDKQARSPATAGIYVPKQRRVSLPLDDLAEDIAFKPLILDRLSREDQAVEVSLDDL